MGLSGPSRLYICCPVNGSLGKLETAVKQICSGDALGYEVKAGKKSRIEETGRSWDLRTPSRAEFEQFGAFSFRFVSLSSPGS